MVIKSFLMQICRPFSRWVMMPNDVDPDDFLCEERCSAEKGALTDMAWFGHVLPQLRKRWALRQ